ncbi:MAG: sigma-54-dependent Fis family transcriptional regulator [Acidobacteria bacterium]|nr:sigma-54-dependent Fis family transcriptional regulator [Acidobacteriota bacterium]
MTARLAVVDDDPAFAQFVQVLLHSRGYEVAAYTGGAALLDALRAGAAPQLVLLDVSMPDLDGLETLRAIRQLQPTAQVIMLSGRQAPATIVEAVRLGAADYVLKPGDAEGVGEAALEAAIRNALERESLVAEVARLGAQLLEDPAGVQPCWSSGAAMQPLMAMVERVADSDIGVLILGESGVGKEVIAREIHRRSARRSKPFVKVNCAALPADLLESELFGHERGAFTGAGATRVGKFEFADHGTVVLDEIAEMPAGLQAKLLHVLQDREFARLGSNRPVSVDIRVIAATNRDLEAMMRSGTFREDLYYRLQVIELRVPPLRQRREEIAALVEFFLAKYATTYRRAAPRPSPVLLDALERHDWPGNVRELENMMKRFVVLQDERFILSELLRAPATTTPAAPAQSADPPATATPAAAPAEHGHAPAAEPTPVSAHDQPDDAARHPAPVTIEVEAPGHTQPPVYGADGIDLPMLARAAAQHAERDAILHALHRFRWNRRKAATYLNVSYKTLLNKMKECEITDAVAS